MGTRKTWTTLAASALLAVAAVLALDEDGDLLSDVWEMLHGHSLDPAGDPDGDGSDNLHESRAGTNPNDPASVAEVAIAIRGETATLSWPSVPGKEYELELTSNLTGNVWRRHGLRLASESNALSLAVDPRTPLLLMGGIRLQTWTNLPAGTWMGNFDTYTAAHAPDIDEEVPRLEIPRDQGERYFSKASGYLVPRATGAYRFFVSGDDRVLLHLSPDADPASRQLVAEVPGWTAYNEWDKYPEQRSAWIQLQANTAYYLELRHVEGCCGDHFRVYWEGPGFGPRSLGAEHLAPYLTGEELMGRVASSFFRLCIFDPNPDADPLSNWEERQLGLNPHGPDSAAEAAARMTPGNAVIQIEAIAPRAYEAEGQSAQFLLRRSGNVNPVTVQLAISGSAGAADHDPVPLTIDFPLGGDEAVVVCHPVADGLVEPPETFTVSIAPGAGYSAGPASNATAVIEDGRPSLYLANLRPEGAAVTAASGHSILQLAANRTYWTVSLSFDGLSAAQTAAHIHLADPGVRGPVVHGVPNGDFSDLRWEIVASGALSPADILAGLDAGRLYLNVHSANFPAGEIRGHYRPIVGGQTFEPPPPPPAWNTNSVTAAEAARFLNQATYGATTQDIAVVQALGYEGWIDTQMAMAPTRLNDHVETVLATLSNNTEALVPAHRQEAWWTAAVTAPDQLRQRVAFALSEIFVISDRADAVYNQILGATDYYDMLGRDAFGNYRDLLEDVTLHPMMGHYLSMIRNPKPDHVLGIRPDENYAREVMQLFSIGLWQLLPDGGLRLDAEGRPVPTYDQDDITGLAHVFTGWAYWTDDPEASFWWSTAHNQRPMMMWPDFHDTGEKHLIDGVVLPAGQSGEQDLADALDLLHNHPNTGPFIARRLIQRLVTSNPSRAYVYRVGQTFDDNGAGVRGDLGAVVRAILLDHEARAASAAAGDTHGHLREPLLRATHLLRAFDASWPGDALEIHWPTWSLGQAVLRSPTVFNFFEPDFAPTGPVAERGLVAPEFQIATGTMVVRNANWMYPPIWQFINWNEEVGRLDLADEEAIYAAGGVHALLDHLDVLLCGGNLGGDLRAHLAALDAQLQDLRGDADPDYMTATVIHILVNSPDYVIQR